MYRTLIRSWRRPRRASLPARISGSRAHRRLGDAGFPTRSGIKGKAEDLTTPKVVSPKISREAFLKVSGAGLAGVALLGVAGCGGGRGGQQGGGGGSNTLIVGVDQEPQVLSRYSPSGVAQSTSNTTAGLMEFPVRIMPDLSYAPLLAAEMPKLIGENPQIVEYRLKDGLTWSDGKPLTSADAKWTFEQIMNPDNQIASRAGWEDIERFETPDDLTVRITFSKPYAPWMDLLSDNCPILPKHVYEGKDFDKALNNEVVGSGPYVFKEWKKGQSLTVERNENYWGEKPAITEVVY